MCCLSVVATICPVSAHLFLLAELLQALLDALLPDAASSTVTLGSLKHGANEATMGFYGPYTPTGCRRDWRPQHVSSLSYSGKVPQLLRGSVVGKTLRVS